MFLNSIKYRSKFQEKTVNFHESPLGKSSQSLNRKAHSPHMKSKNEKELKKL